MQQPRVTIIIVNYNGMKFLDNCLKSLKKILYPNYCVIVVDNGSTDGSVDFIRKNYPDYVTLVQNKENLGFLKANNRVLESNLDSDYVLLLNNDTEVEPDWLKELVAVAESDPLIAALQPKLRSLRDREVFDYNGAAGGYLDKYGYTVCRGRVFDTIERDTGQYEDICEVFWAGGSAIFIRQKVLSETGLMDEDFIAHFDEIDLCWRMRLVGYKVLYVPSAVVYHFGGGTPNPQKAYLNQRNNLLTLIKNYSLGNALKYVTGRILFDIINIGYALLRKDFNWVKAILKSFLWIATHPRLIARKRKSVQQIRNVPEADIMRLVMKKSVIIQYFLQGRKTYTRLKGLPASWSE